MTADELVREVLALDAKARASMAHEQLWIEEAQRRSAEIDAGTAVTVSADEALARARARR